MSLFNIHIASQLSGVAAATIRAWEKRYGVLEPQRDENGHRMYTEQDIEKLSLLQRLTESGLAISKIAAIALPKLREMVQEKCKSDPLAQYGGKQEEVDTDKVRTGILLALSMYKLDIISYELDKAKRLLGPRAFALEVIVPLFREIGLRVAQGKLSIAQEHTLSAIVQFHMGQMIALHYTRSEFRPGLVILAAPQGELHEIGLMAACLLCVQYRIQFLYLGKDLPAKALIEAAQQMRPASILLGVTKGHEISEGLTLQMYMQQLNQGLEGKVELFVGGNIKPYVKLELESLKVQYLPTLESLDKFFANYSH